MERRPARHETSGEEGGSARRTPRLAHATATLPPAREAPAAGDDSARRTPDWSEASSLLSRRRLVGAARCPAGPDVARRHRRGQLGASRRHPASPVCAVGTAACLRRHAAVLRLVMIATACLHLSTHVGVVEAQLQGDAYTLEQVRRADYATNCGFGFAGLQCDQVTSCEEVDYCSGHGMCQRGGFCICDPGWQGASCKQSNCPSMCSGHGSCAASGGCVCDAGFTGVICNQVICLGGGNCTGHGACLNGGICECEKGYLGGACDKIDVAQKCSNNGVFLHAQHPKLTSTQRNEPCSGCPLAMLNAAANALNDCFPFCPSLRRIA